MDKSLTAVEERCRLLIETAQDFSTGRIACTPARGLRAENAPFRFFMLPIAERCQSHERVCQCNVNFAR